MIYTNWLNGRDTYIKQLQDNISQKENDVARYRVKSEDLERELNQSNRTKDELLRSEQHYRTKNQQLEALRPSGSSVNVTEERYAERMIFGKQLTWERFKRKNKSYKNSNKAWMT